MSLVINDLSYSYGDRQILSQVSLRIERGQTVAIVGRTGSGKSTLLSCIVGLLPPPAGTVVVNGVDVGKASHRDLATMRMQEIGYVFQHGELLPSLSAVENVALPAMLNGLSFESSRQAADRLLKSMGMQVTDVPALSLSGGERQRTALARALINEPSVLVADEPTGALDTEVRDEVADLLLATTARLGAAVLLVTHDPALAKRADRVYRLNDGRLGEQ